MSDRCSDTMDKHEEVSGAHQHTPAEISFHYRAVTSLRFASVKMESTTRQRCVELSNSLTPTTLCHPCENHQLLTNDWKHVVYTESTKWMRTGENQQKQNRILGFE